MSYKHMDLAWDVPLKSGTEKVLLLALCKYANSQTNQCWPCGDTLAKMTNISKRNIWRIMESLEEQGVIRKDKQDGVKVTYTITIPGLTGDKVSPPPVTRCHRSGDKVSSTGDKVSPELDKEVSKEVGEGPPRRRSPQFFPREIQPIIDKLTAKKERNRTGNLLTHSLNQPTWRTREACELDKQLTRQIKQLEDQLLEMVLS